MINVEKIIDSPHKEPYNKFMQINEENPSPTKGLYELIKKFLSVKLTDGSKLDVVNYFIKVPSSSEINRCIELNGTYSAKVLLDVKLINGEIEQYFTFIVFGSFPIFTERGTFFINGLERIPIIQLLPIKNEKNYPLDLIKRQALLIHHQIELIISRIMSDLKRIITSSNDIEFCLKNFSHVVQKNINDLFKSELCPLNSATNPLLEVSLKRELTCLGPGVIKDKQGGFKNRGIHSSYKGLICPAETPESENIGYTTHLALYSKINSDSKKLESSDKNQIIGVASCLIPFIQHNDNNRVMMGAKNMKQAVPLLKPQNPIIKTGFEKIVAKLSGRAIYADFDGFVDKITDKTLTIFSDGANKNYNLEPMLPTMLKTVTMHKVIVKEEDKVKKGQVIADGACILNGELSLGTNLLVAYMPYYGYNFEDGIVISDRLVKEDILTSLHLWDAEIEIYGNESEDNHISVSTGANVKKGEILFRKIRHDIDANGDKKVYSSNVISPVDGTIIKKNYVPINIYSSQPEDIKYKKIVLILEKHKIQVGDKIMGRHGNKGVVAKIVPKDEMPHLLDGTPIDVVLNPHGVISRMNLGQILETHWGFVVFHDNENYPDRYKIIEPFENISEVELIKGFKRLEQKGIDVDEQGKVVLKNGIDGQAFKNRIVVGYQYIMKLNHLVSHKVHARGLGPYSLLTEQPTKGKKNNGGQRLGEMEVWALEAHNAQINLQEFLTQNSDEINIRDATELNFIKIFLKESRVLNKPVLPETLRAAVILFRSLNFDINFFNNKNEEVNIFKNPSGLGLSKAKIKIADKETIIEKWKAKKVYSSAVPRLKGKELKGVDGSLYDSAIFADINDKIKYRQNIGYIQLESEIFHPLLVASIKEDWEKICNSSSLIDIIYYKKIKLIDENKNDEIIEFDKTKIESNVKVLGGVDLVLDLLNKTTSVSEIVKEKIKKCILSYIPVLPLAFRPVILQDDKIIPSSLNKLYKSILYCNEKIEQLKSKSNFNVIDMLILKRRLQGAITKLFKGDKFTKAKNIRTIGDMIDGKEGILRKHLLGKRIDFSGRSVIVPDPELLPNQFGLPVQMAKKIIFEPYKNLKDIVFILNRAPSLHKYNTLAFEPKLIDDIAIKINPLVCKSFNADFDGDTMGVFLPVSKQSQMEAKEKMRFSKNLISNSNGEIMAHLAQDIPLGIYLMTRDSKGLNEFKDWFKDCSFVLDIKSPVNAAKLKDLVLKFVKEKDENAAINLLTNIMKNGFKWATEHGLTFSIFDIPFIKQDIRQGIKDIKEIDKLIETAIDDLLKDDNPVSLMYKSGARGNITQIRQLGGMRGQLLSMDNKLLPIITHNFRGGIPSEEFYMASYASRRTMCEKKLSTAKAGDLTRNIVEAAYRVIIEKDDCQTENGIIIRDYTPLEQLFHKIQGDNKFKFSGFMEFAKRRSLREKLTSDKDLYRSVLTCAVKPPGICAKCYGIDVSTQALPPIDLPVGIIAGQSIGEKGTQLTLRTFHTGGAGGNSIVENLSQMKKLLNDQYVKIPVYKIEDKKFYRIVKTSKKFNNENLPMEIDSWRLYILCIYNSDKIHELLELITPLKNKFVKKRLSDMKYLNFIHDILLLEGYFTYGESVHEKHYEVVLRSILSYTDDHKAACGQYILDLKDIRKKFFDIFIAPDKDKESSKLISGLQRSASNQPSFIAASAYRNALSIIAKAAIDEKEDPLEYPKEKLMTGKF
ncbi:MAG: hypothetical protein HQK76_12740 [Desulfobacterales bacterium]|nr:hypothetical protein [Desulfobacterales bacterium]